MIYGSVCSGIEAASVAWSNIPGWQPAFFSEIDPFCRSVLQYRFPNVPLHGDFTTIEDGMYEPIDLLVGGTPCQSFSVAGLRGGMNDERGNLTLEFVRLARRLKPKYILWENVPGVLSSNGGRDFASFLEGLEEIGYIVDIDIHDAQFYGVPQRRRRVFVCAQHRDDLLNQRTHISALTIIQCLQEILLGILSDQSQEFESKLSSLGLAYLSKDGALRRMKLFDLLGEKSSFELLRENLIEVFLKSVQEQSISVAYHGEPDQGTIAEGLLTAFQTVEQFTLTERSLKDALDESYEAMKSFITSTAISEITQMKIFSFSKRALLIAKLIPLLNRSSPSWWSAASSSLIALEAYIKYARQSSSSLFTELEWIHSWHDFIGEAERVIKSIRYIGDSGERAAQILFDGDGVCRHSHKSKKTGKSVAALTATGVGTCGVDDNQAQSGHLIAHTLRDGEPQIEVESGDTSPALRAVGGGSSHAFVSPQLAVRRLMPVETEKLQGFPSGWTDVPYRGKPAADGPRYKSIGNSMCVNVMRWIGERISEAESSATNNQLLLSHLHEAA